MESIFVYNINGAVSSSTDTRWIDGSRKQRKWLQGLVSFTLGLEGWDVNIDPQYEQTRRKSYPMRRKRATDVMELT